MIRSKLTLARAPNCTSAFQIAFSAWWMVLQTNTGVPEEKKKLELLHSAL